MTTARTLRLFLGLTAALALAACHGDTSTGPAPHSGPPRYNNPSALIDAHAQALTNRDLEAYTNLLDESFRYFPQSEDLSQLPWMTGDSWGRADELGMIGHMFDPHFQPPRKRTRGALPRSTPPSASWTSSRRPRAADTPSRRTPCSE